MTVHGRNNILTACTLLATFYLLLAEAYPRYASTMREYSAARAREKSLMTRDEFLSRKRDMETERQRLENLRKEKYAGEGREGGVLFGYFNSLAKKSGIVVASFSPVHAGRAAERDSRAFSVEFKAAFHRTAGYINAVETGALPIRLSSLEMISDPPGSPRLRVSFVAATGLVTGTR